MARLTLLEFTITGIAFSITDDMTEGDVVWLSWNDNGQWKVLDSHIIDEKVDVMEWLQTMVVRFKIFIDRLIDNQDPGTDPTFPDWQSEAKYRIANNLEVVNGELVIKV